jgi:hypothetical protein
MIEFNTSSIIEFDTTWECKILIPPIYGDLNFYKRIYLNKQFLLKKYLQLDNILLFLTIYYNKIIENILLEKDENINNEYASIKNIYNRYINFIFSNSYIINIIFGNYYKKIKNYYINIKNIILYLKNIDNSKYNNIMKKLLQILLFIDNYYENNILNY